MLGRAQARPELVLRGGPGDSEDSGGTSSPCTGDYSSRSTCDGSLSCIGTTMSISPDGQVFPCHWLTTRAFLIGNVRTDSLERLCERLQNLRGSLGGPSGVA